MTTIPACGVLSGVLVDGSSTVTITDASGSGIWYGRPGLVQSETHLSDTFVPGLAFRSDLTLTVNSASGGSVHSLVYGAHVSC